MSSLIGDANSSWFADIKDAWAATGYDPSKRVKDPLCQLYSDQFHKVQEALWQSKFPDYDKYFPYANTNKPPAPTAVNHSPPSPTQPNAPPQDEQERLLEMYIENGEEPVVTPKAPSPSSKQKHPKTNEVLDHPKKQTSPTSQRSPILELLLFVVCGLFFILLLDLFFRMGYAMGRISVI